MEPAVKDVVRKKFNELLVSAVAHYSKFDSNSSDDQLKYAMTNSDLLKNFAKKTRCYTGPDEIPDVL